MYNAISLVLQYFVLLIVTVQNVGVALVSFTITDLKQWWI